MTGGGLNVRYIGRGQTDWAAAEGSSVDTRLCTDKREIESQKPQTRGFKKDLKTYAPKPEEPTIGVNLGFRSRFRPRLPARLLQALLQPGHETG